MCCRQQALDFQVIKSDSDLDSRATVGVYLLREWNGESRRATESFPWTRCDFVSSHSLLRETPFRAVYRTATPFGFSIDRRQTFEHSFRDVLSQKMQDVKGVELTCTCVLDTPDLVDNEISVLGVLCTTSGDRVDEGPSLNRAARALALESFNTTARLKRGYVMLWIHVSKVELGVIGGHSLSRRFGHIVSKSWNIRFEIWSSCQLPRYRSFLLSSVDAPHFVWSHSTGFALDMYSAARSVKLLRDVSSVKESMAKALSAARPGLDELGFSDVAYEALENDIGADYVDGEYDLTVPPGLLLGRSRRSKVGLKDPRGTVEISAGRRHFYSEGVPGRVWKHIVSTLPGFQLNDLVEFGWREGDLYVQVLRFESSRYLPVFDITVDAGAFSIRPPPIGKVPSAVMKSAKKMFSKNFLGFGYVDNPMDVPARLSLDLASSDV